jgi:hypothetical protein
VLSLVSGRARRAVTKERAIPISRSRYHRFEKEESGVTTRELAKFQATKRTCGSIDNLQIPVGIKRVDPAQGHIERS